MTEEHKITLIPKIRTTSGVMEEHSTKEGSAQKSAI